MPFLRCSSASVLRAGLETGDPVAFDWDSLLVSPPSCCCCWDCGLEALLLEDEVEAAGSDALAEVEKGADFRQSAQNDCCSCLRASVMPAVVKVEWCEAKPIMP
jgi:hypothetical protein